jgi:hypothetical protein
LAQGAATDLYTLIPQRVSGNWLPANFTGKRAYNRRCYHHIEVKPESIGRVLGIGLRVAGRMAGQAMNGDAQTNAKAASGRAAEGAATTARRPVDAADRGRSAGQATRGLAKGVGGFLRPFQRVGGTIWLEVTGVLFFLPVLIFSPVLWRTHLSYAHGPGHRDFVISTVIVALFLYLSVSSFWRARKR